MSAHPLDTVDAPRRPDPHVVVAVSLTVAGILAAAATMAVLVVIGVGASE